MQSLEKARKDFYSTLEMFKKVHTREELETVEDKLKKVRQSLWEIDPEFRAMVEENKMQAKIKREEIRALGKIKIAGKDSIPIRLRLKGEEAKRKIEDYIEEWIQEHRVKVLTPEKVAHKEELLCPICLSSDRKNVVNGIPFCIQCRHKLVSKSNLKEYNRTYRRKWNRKMKKR